MSIPSSIVIHVGKYIDSEDRLCNHDCLFCIERMEPGGSVNVLPSLSEIREAVQNCKSACSEIACIYVAGGEPTMRADLDEILSLLRQHCEKIVLSSNCDYADSRNVLRLLQSHQVYEVATSLHGASAKTHDMLTQCPGSFSRTVNTVRLFLKNGFRVYVNYVVCAQNIAEMCQAVGMFSEWNPTVEHLTFTHYARHGNAFYHEELSFSVWNHKEDISAVLDTADKTGMDVRFRDFPICLDSRIAERLESVSDISIPQLGGDDFRIIPEKAPFMEIEQCQTCKFEAVCPKLLAANYSEVTHGG